MDARRQLQPASRRSPSHWITVLLRILLLALAAAHGGAAGPNETTPWAGHRVAPTEAGPDVACSEVQQIFVTKQIGDAQMVPESAISGKGLEICSADTSCCTKQMEEKYTAAVKRDYASVLLSTSSIARSMLATQTAQLQEHLQLLLQRAETATHTLLAEVHQRLAPQAELPVATLFTQLAAVVRGDAEADVATAVSSFFNGLFPLVYRHSINPKLQDLSADYDECLRATQAELRPFGDAPRHLASRLANTLLASRALLQGLTLGVEVLNATAHAPVAASCQRALVGLLYCPHCRALTTVRPCSGYCVNVVRGCTAPVAELDNPWSDAVGSMERLSLSLQRNSHDPEEALNQVHGRISEAIMHAMEQGPQLAQQVKKACGHPQRVVREAPEDAVVSPFSATTPPSSLSATPTSARPVPPSSSSLPARLQLRLQSLMRSLSGVRSFYSSLADHLCSDDTLSERGEGHCWNGHSVGQYSKTIVGIGLGAQKYNSEVAVPQTPDAKVSQLTDKLKHMRQVLLTHVASIPESDSLVNDGSGSGWNHNNNYNGGGDDEDYNDSDGSGDGSGDGGADRPPYQRRTNTGRDKWNKNKNRRPVVTGINDGLSFEQSEDDMDNEVSADSDAARVNNKKSKSDAQRPRQPPGGSGSATATTTARLSTNLFIVAGVVVTTAATTLHWMHD